MPATKGNRFLLLYGSQTGQAQAIAEEIAEKAGQHGLQADLQCLSGVEKKFHIEREKCIVMVTSTTGDGEPPDTALKFARRLRKKTLPKDYLKSLHFALLGLGDSNYTNFCNCGKSLDRRLLELGATHFYDSGWADDATGLEVVVEPWIDGLWAALRTHLHLPVQNGSGDVMTISPLVASNSLTTGSPPQPDRHSCDSALISVAMSSVTPLLFNGIGSGDGSRQSNLKEQLSGDNKLEHSTTLENGTAVDTKLICDNLKEEDTCSTNDEKPNSDLTHKAVSAENSAITSQTLTQTSIKSEVPNSSATSNVESTIHQDTVLSLNSSDKTVISDRNQSNANTTSENVLNSSSRGAGDSSAGGGEGGPSGSVRVSLPPLSESTLSVPLLSPQFLKVDFEEGEPLGTDTLPLQNGCDFPSAASPVTMATVESIKTLTQPSAVKTTLAIQLDIEGCDIQYEPGDSFSVICPNPAEEVNRLMKRLGVLDRADDRALISVLPGTKKKNAAIPLWISPVTTVRHLLTTCLDIRQPPKKALLRCMVEHTSDAPEKRRLQELCSKQGSGDYTQYIREPSLSVLDLLQHFPSCQLPLHTLFEQLPRLQPRPYSVCSSPLRQPSNILFAFNVIKIPEEGGRTYARQGVCTGWLDTMRVAGSCQQDGLSPRDLKDLQGNDSAEDSHEISSQLEKISLQTLKIPIFARGHQHFHLPGDIGVPLILVGPGTGVAPFIGFLEHRAAQHKQNPEASYGETWLFYGCRHKDRDYLFRSRLEQYSTSSVLTQLYVSFSRDEQPEGSPRYVQDNIRANWSKLGQLIVDQGALVYVCGDAKHMARDVNEAFVHVISQHTGMNEDESKKFMMKLRIDKRYREDVWT